MSPGLQAVLALFPIALGGVLLVGFSVPAKRAMPAAYVAAAAVAYWAWHMAPTRIVAASIQGLFLSFDLSLQLLFPLQMPAFHAVEFLALILKI